MRVSEFLALPEFSHFELIAGASGTDREIVSMTVIDSPDSYLYFKGGELLLTNTYFMRNDTSLLEDMIASCSHIGVAAIALKIGRFITEVPPTCLALADELGFPLISIPMDLAFADIINRVLMEINNKQNRQLRFSEKVHTAFTSLALRGGSVQEIVEILSDILDRPVLYWDLWFERLYRSGTAQPAPIREAGEDLNALLARHPSYIQQVDGVSYGYLILAGDSPAGEEVRLNTDIAAQHAGTVLKLSIQKHISNMQIESKHRDEFVQDLLLGRFTSLDRVHQRSQVYGWRFQRGVTAFAVDFADIPAESGVNTDYLLARKVRQRYRASMYTKLGDQMVFLVETGEDSALFLRQLQDFCQELLRELRGYYDLRAHIGIGSPQPTLLEAPRSYHHAQTAVKVGAQAGMEAPCYHQLGLFRLLQSCDSRCREEYLDRYILTLRRYDEAHRTEYLQTLQCLIRNDWNLQDTARELYLHYNTVKNRFYKIGDLLGMDLRSGEAKVELTIACKLLLLN